MSTSSANVTSPTNNDLELDLGVLKTKRQGETLMFFAPSALVRGVWLLGAAGCLLFLWSIVVSLGWLELQDGRLTGGRLPYFGETLFWLLPLILAFVLVMLSRGGVHLSLTEAALTLRGKNKDDVRLELESLHYARFYEETTDSGETLYGCRFLFQAGSIQFFIANKRVWQNLRERFDPNVTVN
ncbi:MAG: hypothetical protein AAF267_24980 [Deinococcota bacterium]